MKLFDCTAETGDSGLKMSGEAVTTARSVSPSGLRVNQSRALGSVRRVSEKGSNKEEQNISQRMRVHSVEA